MIIEIDKGQKASFYIARVGSLAGKPLKQPYTSNNSFVVISDTPERDYAKAMHLYLKTDYYGYKHGTCQPAIRIRDIRKLLNNHVVTNHQLIEMQRVIDLIEVREKELILLNQLLKATVKKRV